MLNLGSARYREVEAFREVCFIQISFQDLNRIFVVKLFNIFRIKMSIRRKSQLVHSLSMFQTKPTESKGNSYQPPLFTTSSCDSILDESKRSNGYARQNTRRSQSGSQSKKAMKLIIYMLSPTIYQNLFNYD